ncbi:MAG: hypothetical protein ACRDHW_03970 [Ktedonobacteraceae bacterium]
MNQHDIRLLQNMQDYPAISLLIPTHRTSPDNNQDPIRVKNLVTEAKNRLSQEFSWREVDPLLSNLDKIVSQIDYPRALDGLALFASQQGAHAFVLPFQPRERVAIDETFATRDLVMALHHLQRYWVLVLSEKPTRLYEGTGETLIEAREEGFPLVHRGPGGETALPGGYGISRSAARDEHQRQFFRQVDTSFGRIFADDSLPLVVVGVDRYLAFFQELSQHTRHLVATLKGSHGDTPPHELAQLVWPLMREYQDRRRQQTLEELAVAVSAQKYVSTVGEVWRLANEGRGRILVVEEDFHYPARVDESGIQVSPASDATAPGVIDDIVDEIIEVVLAKGGEVRFVADGSLQEHQRIALILRY